MLNYARYLYAKPDLGQPGTAAGRVWIGIHQGRPGLPRGIPRWDLHYPVDGYRPHLRGDFQVLTPRCRNVSQDDLRLAQRVTNLQQDTLHSRWLGFVAGRGIGSASTGSDLDAPPGTLGLGHHRRLLRGLARQVLDGVVR